MILINIASHAYRIILYINLTINRQYPIKGALLKRGDFDNGHGSSIISNIIEGDATDLTNLKFEIYPKVDGKGLRELFGWDNNVIPGLRLRQALEIAETVQNDPNNLEKVIESCFVTI